jgi:hypothetical protein
MDIASQMVGLLDRFCGGFAAGDAATVTAACDMNPDLIVVTSEQLVLRGGEELAAFLRDYERGPTRYAWAWDRHDVCGYADVGWLLATGTETATTGAMTSSNPYRMTMVATRRSGDWSLVQVHGSSPHHDSPAESPIRDTT